MLVESFPIEVQRAAALFDFFVVAVGVSRKLVQGSPGKVGTRPLYSTKGGRLFDELLLVIGTAPLLHTNLRAEACEKLDANGCTFERRWQLCHARHTGSLAYAVRFGQGEKNFRGNRLE